MDKEENEVSRRVARRNMQKAYVTFATLANIKDGKGVFKVEKGKDGKDHEIIERSHFPE